MSDRIAIFRHGRVEQVGTGEELYEQPASLFVGQFMGESTVLRGVLQTAPGEWVVVGARWRIRVAPDACRRVGVGSGSRVAVVVRPERLRIGPALGRTDPGGGFNCVGGTVLEQMYLGSVRKYVIDLGDGDQAIVRSQVGAEAPSVPARGSVQISWDLAHGVVVADERDVGPAVQAQGALPFQTGATDAGRAVGAP
jgi:putative spermidine/putrescine transport system ATP-binding protein